MKQLTKAFLIIILSLGGVSSCSSLAPFKVAVLQGNIIEDEDVEQLVARQVRAHLLNGFKPGVPQQRAIAKHPHFRYLLRPASDYAAYTPYCAPIKYPANIPRAFCS